jgi:septal ring factor EnvC (AmiA/AmiB activator)
MAPLARTVLALAFCLLPARAVELQANPIRKVVTLLQNMQQKVTAEGEKEEELYKKFMCYCKTGVGELQSRIDSAGTKEPQLEADITSSEESLTQTKADLKSAQQERTDAKAAIASATAIREKGAADSAATKGELEGYLSQIKSAVAALESGMAGSFLQTAASAALRKLVLKDQNMFDDDREQLLSFLSGKEGYAPKSGEIVGILKQMGDDFSKELKGAEDAEATAVKDTEALIGAKTKEIETLTESIEAKLVKVGELGTSIASMKADFEDVAGSLLEDKKLLADLKDGCGTKDAEYAERVKTRNTELATLAETIKILNDDDALELFKKTLPAPSASLVQVQVSTSDLRARAVQALHQAHPVERSSRLNFLVLALRGKKIGFDKVIAMIEDLVATLKKEQVDDDNKKEYCASSFDSSEDTKKELTRKLSDTEAAISSAEEGIMALVAEIKEAKTSIGELDNSVAQATALRKEQNEDFKALIQSDSAAKELLGFAKNRLNKFYNPKLYNPPAKVELSEMGAISRDMSLVQVSEHSQHKSSVAPPPETWDAYAKKSEESTGVIAMIDLLVKDLDTEMTEAEVEEKNAQQEYDTWMADAKKDRTGLSKSLTEKTAAKADLEEDQEKMEDEKKATTAELMATDKFISNLHAECDWLVQYFDVRKAARAGEIDSLDKAKAVLSGADYSLLQKQSRGLRRRAQ